VGNILAEPNINISVKLTVTKKQNRTAGEKRERAGMVVVLLTGHVITKKKKKIYILLKEERRITRQATAIIKPLRRASKPTPLSFQFESEES